MPPVLCVYALVSEPIDGLDAIVTPLVRPGDRLRMVSTGACHAVIGEHAEAPALAADVLTAQDALVRELASRSSALLPARFGSQFEDESALRAALDPLAPRLAAALDRVRGREQMTLRLFAAATAASAAPASAAAMERPPDPSAASFDSETPHSSAGSGPIRGAAVSAAASRPAGPGTDYLLRRVAAAQFIPPAVDAALRAPLAPLIAAERRDRGRPPVIGSIHHLIPRGAADAYRAAIAGVEAVPDVAASGIRFRVSGPSPAYAFAEVGLT